MKVAFQGIKGAYSELAITEAFGKDTQTVPVVSFEELFEVVQAKGAERAMVPVENSAAGRVKEIHYLLAQSHLHIVGEHYQQVRHCLVGVAKDISEVKLVHSHIQALSQCRRFILNNRFSTIATVDTAAAARKVAEQNDPSAAAVASKMAAEVYGLNVLAEGIQDQADNTTRFVILASKAEVPPLTTKRVITSVLFHTTNKPAALYKALGCFASQSLNLTRLEGLVTDAGFAQARFYADIEAHTGTDEMKRALEGLEQHTRWVKVLGVYEAHPHRRGNKGKPTDAPTSGDKPSPSSTAPKEASGD